MSTYSSNSVMIVAGARPNFMKIAPIVAELDKMQVKNTLVHTGQHYDQAMSDSFFEELNIKLPDFNLNIGSDTHARQTAKIMEAFEPIVTEFNPSFLVVVGDVNSTLAAALTAVKVGVKVAHVEAGLRSFDKTMPEEINRIVVDHISDILFAPSQDGVVNLKNEGLLNKTELVGNVMVDTLTQHLNSAIKRPIVSELGVDRYGLLTLHRPSNVDDKEVLKNLIEVIIEISKTLQIVFPCHPRTKDKIKEFNLPKTIKVIDPVSYFDSIALQSAAKVVLTDSGGMQEECTILGVPCLTLRDNTERPITVSEGTNFIVGNDKNKILSTFNQVINKEFKASVPYLWDGQASKRIVQSLVEKME